MLFAVKLILKDLDEHGKENIYLYDDKPIFFWKEKQKELENDRKDRINSGKKSDVFSRFSKKPNHDTEKLFIVTNELAEEILVENKK
ncbi:hypothetical protein [Leptospira weilii]|uniref:Uncharacterized protein n=1 Tax=Leptospira weilii str. UI 13098 TaxID=1088542 RepID=M6Q549_9LEPT|nr:hypothetical protein [Leptospira weilii]EMN88325.1 hypothetical protein LEP1GSC108_1557 [Leptospira weilii str. UI 13098]